MKAWISSCLHLHHSSTYTYNIVGGVQVIITKGSQPQLLHCSQLCPARSQSGMATASASRTEPLRHFVRANFSPAFLYPLKGIWYFATHRYLHPLLQSRLIPLTLLSTCVLAILFLTAYLPLVAFLALFHTRGSAWVNATFFLLGVGAVVIQLLFEGMLVDHTQVDVYDAVLVGEGYEHLVKNRRIVSDDINESDPYKRLGTRDKGAAFSPFSLRQIIELLFLLPLNLVPFAGVPLFLVLTGYRAGPLLNWRYFQLRRFDSKQRKQFIKTKARRWEYMWYGTVHITLQLIPVLAMLFLLTTAAGSALWSVQLEQRLQQSQLVQQSEEDDEPPAYTDEP